MSSISLGDMAQSFIFQKRSAQLRTEMTRLSDELASGQVSDPKSVLGGNFSYLADIERDMRGLEAYKIAGAEAEQFASGAQASLERVQLAVSDLSNDLLSVASSTSAISRAQGAVDARGQLDVIVNALNATVAGRSLFSGTATQTVPLVDSATLMTSLEAAVAGATTSGGLIAAAQTWFNDPAGFEAVAYQGATTDLAPFRLSQSESVTMDIRADDPQLRDAIMYAAIAAISDSPAISLALEERTDLLNAAGVSLLATQQDVVGLRSRVGTAESRIDTLNTRNAAEAVSLDFARKQLLEADPFDTATALENVQFSLQSLYTVTSRSADLALVNFLR